MIYVIYDTDGLLATTEPTLWKTCYSQLRYAVKVSGAKLITVQNDMNAVRSHTALYNNILSGIKSVPSTSSIYLAEHDVLYPPFYFQRKAEHPIEYNSNSYLLSKESYFDNPCKTLSNCRGQSDFLHDAILQKHEESTAGNLVWAEPYNDKAPNFRSHIPTIDIRHSRNFTSGQSLKGQRQNIPQWRDSIALTNQLGLNPTHKE